MKEDNAYLDLLMRNGSYAPLSFIEYMSTSTLSNSIWSDKYTRANVRCVAVHALYLGISSDTFLWQAIGYDAFDKEGVKM